MKNQKIKKLRNSILLGFFMIILVQSGAAQEIINGGIVGKVVDAKTGKPLFGVNIIVKKTLFGTSSDIKGNFSITNLPIGIYDIEASMIGYEKQIKRQIQIFPGEKHKIIFKLIPTVIEQPALVVTASKRKQHIEDAPTSVDVVTMKEIQERGATTLDEILQNTTGFGIIDGQIDLRGSTGFNWSAGSRVLLMVDGHPLINGDTGGINWDAIPIEEVKRVEIVKGTGSALYGSNAMAGMVNIITRDPTPFPETRFKLSWGFYDEPSYPEWRWTDRFLPYKIFHLKKLNPLHTLSFGGIDISHSRRIGKVGILFTVGRKQSSGYQENGDFSRWNVMGKAKIRFSPQKSLTITGSWALNNHGDFLQWVSQNHPMEVPANELGNRVRYGKSDFNATFNSCVNERFAYTLKTSAYRCHWQNFFQDNRDYAITDRINTEVQTDYLWKKHSFTFGGEIVANYARSLIYGNHNMWDFALYGQDELKVSPLWTFTLGTRYDFHRVTNVSFDQQISPRLGLVYKPYTGTSFRFSAGYGFRAPSIAEIFANINVSGFPVVPNLNLKEAERAWSFEAGIHQKVNLKFFNSTHTFWENPLKWGIENFNPNFIIDLALFWNHYRNMIDVDLNPELMAFQFKNFGRARNRGAEIKIIGSAFDNHLSATAGYTFADPRDIDTGKMLNYRSKHRVVTSVKLRLGRLSFGLDYRYASRIEEVVNIFSTDQRVPMHVMDGRIVLNLRSLQISLEGKNLRNYNYSLRQRSLEPIRHFIITVRGKF